MSNNRHKRAKSGRTQPKLPQPAPVDHQPGLPGHSLPQLAPACRNRQNNEREMSENEREWARDLRWWLAGPPKMSERWARMSENEREHFWCHPGHYWALLWHNSPHPTTLVQPQPPNQHLGSVWVVYEQLVLFSVRFVPGLYILLWFRDVCKHLDWFCMLLFIFSWLLLISNWFYMFCSFSIGFN